MHSIRRLGAAALLALLAVTGAWAAPGDLDPTFDGDGLLRRVFSERSSAEGVALQADGRIVMVGTAFTGTASVAPVARFLADGSPDTSFNGTGATTLSLSPSGGTYARAVAMQPDGRLLVAGHAWDGGSRFMAARLRGDGTLDSSFGSGSGRILLDFPGTTSPEAHALALQPDGKVVLAGDAFVNGVRAIAVARLLPDGTPDNTFNGNGRAIRVSGSVSIRAVLVQSDGRIVAAGTHLVVAATGATVHSLVLARFNADGTPDAGFGDNGLVLTDVDAWWAEDAKVALAELPGGKLIAAASTSSGDLVFVRYLSSGRPDAGFGDAGIGIAVMPANVTVAGIVLLADGGWLIGGSIFNGTIEEGLVARFTADGKSYSTFAAGGRATASFPSGSFPVRAIARQADGRVILAGSNQHFAAMRFDMRYATTAVLSTSGNTSNAGQPVTFTAGVQGGVGFSGTFAFLDGGTAIAGCAAVPVSGYQASCTTSTLASGAHSITAAYSGDDQYNGSVSPALAFQVLGSSSAPPSSADMSGDGRPDLLVRNASTGSTYLWRMDGLRLAGDQLVTTIDPSWRLIGQGDFNGDGHTDIVWRHGQSGSAFVWYLRAGAFVSDAFLFTIDPAWQVESVNDFNRDGRPDFLFRHATSGTGFLWHFRDTAPLSDRYLFTIDNQWMVENTGDFDGDGYPDFLFRNRVSGLAFVWKYDGTRLADSFNLFSTDPRWQVVQIADWNRDGRPDLVMRHAQSGVTFVWYTNGTQLIGSDTLFQLDAAWTIVPYRN